MNIINLLNMKAFVMIFLISIFIYIFSLPKNTTPICDIEKKSKFILECIKADTTKDLRAIGACEQMSLRLYCK